MNNKKKLLVVGLVTIVLSVVFSTSGSALPDSGYKGGSIAGTISDFTYNDATGGTITVTNANGQSITMIIPPGTLSYEAYCWIMAAMRYGWIVQASYIGCDPYYLKNLEIFPVFAPVDLVFKQTTEYVDVISG